MIAELWFRFWQGHTICLSDLLQCPNSYYSVIAMDFFPEYSGKGVKVTTHIHPVQQLRMPGYLPPFPHDHTQGQMYLYHNCS
jgi:hypothetical protein